MSKRGQNEGSIRQRKNGMWEARFTTGKYTDDGKSIRQSVYGKTKTEVREKLKKALGEIQSGEYIIEKDITFGSWMKEWLDVYKKNSIRQKTFQVNYSAVQVHIVSNEIGKIKLKDLRNDHIQKLYNTLNECLSPASIKRLHSVISGGLTQAVKNEIIRKNPAEDVSLPKMKQKQIQIMTYEEQKIFQDALKNERLATAFIFALQSGLRLGELLALSWHDINFDKKTIRVKNSVQRVKVDFSKTAGKKSKLVIEDPKSEAGKRSIPLMESAIEILKVHERKQLIEKEKAGTAYSNNNFVFATALGNIIEPRNLIRKFKKILKDNNLPNINFHALRHTFVSRLLEAGVNIKTVSEIIGHTKTSLTMDIYAHVLPEGKQDAVAKINHLFDDQSKK